MSEDRDIVEDSVGRVVSAWRHVSPADVGRIEDEAVQLEENATRVAGFGDLIAKAAVTLDLCTLWRAIQPDDLVAPDGVSWRRRAEEFAEVALGNASEITRLRGEVERLREGLSGMAEERSGGSLLSDGENEYIAGWNAQADTARSLLNLQGE